MKRPSWFKFGSGSGLPSAVWIVPFSLAVLVPGLFTQTTESRIHAFRPELYVAETMVVLVFGLTVALILYFAFYQRNLGRSLGTASVLVLVFFTWPLWTDMAGNARRIVDVDIVVDALAIALAATLVWLAVRYSGRDSTLFFVAATSTGVVLLFTLVVLLAPRFVGAPVDSGPSAGPGPHPNAVILILDGYARQDVLDASFGAEGMSLVSALSDRGFVIKDNATTNYSRTYASVSSMLAMDYSFGEGIRSEESLAHMRRLLTGDNPLVHGYHNAGYTVTAYENWWWGTQCGQSIDNCTRADLVELSLWSLGQSSPLASIQRSTVPHPIVTTGVELIRELGEQIEEDRATPQLVVAHVTVPHPPLQLDASCSISVGSVQANELAPSYSPAAQSAEAERPRFLEQTLCIDREVIAAIDQLLTIDPDLAVLVLSDHGPETLLQAHAKSPDEWSDEALLERMAVLTAMRVPANCESTDLFQTTVNAIRFFVSCTTGAQLDMLRERIYFVPPSEWADLPLVEITDRMHSMQNLSGR